MSEESSTSRMTSVYQTAIPNEPIELYSGPMTLRSESEEITGTGTLRLEWLPSPALRFRLNAPSVLTRDLRLAFGFSDIDVSQLSFDKLGTDVEAIALTTKSGSNSELEVSGIVKGEVLTGEDKSLSSLQFHLPNVPDFQLSPHSFLETVGSDARHVQRIQLLCDKWIVTIDPLLIDKRQIDEIRSTRGYAITSVGQVKRRDGKSFSRKQAKPILETVQYLMSFALHRWCTPMLLIGRDQADVTVCETWVVGRTSPFQAHTGWFDFHHPGALARLFPVMHRRYRDKHWRQVLCDAIYWYVEMHEQPVRIETSILLGQVTLEMLGWHRLVEDVPTLSESAFRQLPAADKLKLLLSFCSIPIAAPQELDEIQPLAKARNWQGPDIVVEVRNGIVHQNRRKREQSEEKNLSGHVILSETCRLVCQYVELVLLQLLEYKGTYSNRTKRRWIGSVEPVPWAPGGDNECDSTADSQASP